LSQNQDVSEIESEDVEGEIVDDEEATIEDQEATTYEVPEEEAEDTEPKSELELLQDALAEAEAKSAEYLDGWQRAQAEFQNYKRRTEIQMGELRRQTASNVLSRFFPVLDDLELALENLPDDGDSGRQWSDGIQLVHRKWAALLEAEGVTLIEVEAGLSFDPNFHEALTQEENDEFEEGEIIEIVRRGYQMGERVLRPAQVRVAR